MARYKFLLSKKITIWENNKFTVEAETEEEARKIAEQFLNPSLPDVSESEDSDVDFIESELLYETEEEMTPEQNGGNPTRELAFIGKC